MKSFNDLADFENDEIAALLSLAERLRTHPEPEALRGKVLSLLFLSPSLRTLASFQAAMTRLGGGAFVISPDMSIHGLETRPGIVMDGTAAEHIREAVPVIASYGDAIGIRAFAERRNLDDDVAETEFKALTSLIDTPWINMESALNHPCQSLADWKTLDDLAVPAEGGKFVLSWAYHPNALPLAVPSATVYMAARRGMDVTVLRPPGFALPDAVMQKGRRTPQTRPAARCLKLTTGTKRINAAHVVYAKSWSSTQHYGDRAADAALRADFRHWCVDEQWFSTAHARLPLHALPAGASRRRRERRRA